MVSNGWKRLSVAQMDAGSAYQNSRNSASQVNPANIVAQPPSRLGASIAQPSPRSAKRCVAFPSVSMHL
jgi:chitin deacetylase